MRNENKVRIIVALIILLAWGLYINFIYVDAIGMDMDVCREHMNASTKICNGVYTNFGGGLI